MNKSSLLRWASWHRIGLILLAVVVSLLILLIHLGSLAPQLSPIEKLTLASSTPFHVIVQNPMNFPLKLLQWLTIFAPYSHILLVDRLPSVLLSLLSIVLFIYILRHWYGPRSTFFGFCILLASAWFIHISRFAGTDIEYFTGVITLLAVQLGLNEHRDRTLMFYIWLLTNLILLFIPGFIWLIILSIFWQRSILLDTWQKLRPYWNRLGWLVLAIIGLVILIFKLIQTPHLIRIWLGAPDHFASWLTIMKQLANTFLAPIYSGPHNPQLWLGHLPILDAFLSLMLAIGIAFYVQHWQAERSRLLLSYFLIATILVSLGGQVRLSIIVPFLYLVIVAGIAYLLSFWLKVFPRNPLARGVGISIITLIIAMSCFYNLQQYFVAWPSNPETIQVYRPVSP